MEYAVRRIIQQMQALGWGQEKLASEAGVSQSTVNRFLNQGADTRISTIIRIAKALKLPPEYLTTEDETKALLCLELSRMSQEDIRNTLLFMEKEKLYKETKKVS